MNCSHNIYIHVPFCQSKCKYCAFYSLACKKPDWDEYVKNICNEIYFWTNKLGKVNIPSIFLGGGTPSLMPIHIFETIIGTINQYFNIDKDCEISIEVNPGTIDKIKLNDFIRLGVNRVSIGVQSLSDEELKFLGRCHNVEQALNLLEIAQQLNVRVSADFIYGLPNQTVNSVISLCKSINNLNLSHVSLYELTIEKNTPLGNMKLNMPDNITMAQMYESIQEYLNLSRYEISNYAIKGQECKHNQNIWAGDPYIGLGKTAAGRPFIKNQWYEQLGNNELLTPISDEVRAVEKIITGLRTVRGVMLSQDIVNQINYDWINNHIDLVNISNNHLIATSKGMLILDDILTDIIK